MNMAFRKRNFGKGKSLNNVDLGIISRKNSTVSVTVPQVGADGKALNSEAVSKQEFILDSNGKNDIKIKGAYLKQSPFCDYMKNVPTGKTQERRLPLPYAPLSSFDDVDSIPPEIRELEKNGKIPNYLYKKLDDSGNVVSEAREVDGESGKMWVKVDLAVPTYKQYYDEKGNPLTDTNSKGDATGYDQDEKGYYKITMSKYAYAAMCKIGFFNGHAVDEAGNKIAGSEGTYMTEGDFDEDNFLTLHPLRIGGKTRISSRLRKVFMHPTLGVVSDDQVTKGGYLKRGTFKYAGEAVTLAVYNEDGKVAAILDGRNAFKISDFVEKKTRAVTVQSVAQDLSNIAPKDVDGAEEAEEEEEEDLF